MAALAASRLSGPAPAGTGRVPLAALLSLALHGGVVAAVAAWGLPAINAPPALIVEFVAPAPVTAEAAPAPAPVVAASPPAPAEPQPEPLPAVEAPLPIPMTKPLRSPRRTAQPIAQPAEQPAPSSIQAAASAEMATPAEKGDSTPQSASQIAALAATPAAAPAEPLVVTEARFRRPPRPPAYPPRAIALEQEGISVIRALIDTDGSSREVRLWRSSGFALLDQAALVAVRDWAFEAARRGEQPVLAWVEVPVRFEIR